MQSNVWYKRQPVKFIDGTMMLSLEEKGAYSICIDLMHIHGGSIPDDERWLSGVCGCSVRKWKAIRARLISLGKLTAKDDRLTNFRATPEAENYAKLRRDLAEHGARGGRQRAENATKSKEINGVPQAEASSRIEESRIDTVSKDTDAAASASKAVDPKKLVYDEGKSLLKAYGIANGTAGGLITKWLKSHDPPELISAFMEARRAERHDIVEYVVGVLKNGKANETEPIDREAFLARYRARHEG